MEFEQITKIEGATRQLRQAIRLSFERGDVLAVHTLVAAAHGVYGDLGRQQGIRSPLRSDELIRAERLKEWIGALNRTQNFLKHADRDHSATLRFSPESTILYLFETVDLAHRVTGDDWPEYRVFRLWLTLAYPDLVTEPYRATVAPALEAGIYPDDYGLFRQMIDRLA